MSESEPDLPPDELLDMMADAVERVDWSDEEDINAMLRLLTRIGHRLPRKYVEEQLREVDRAEAVGPLLNPTKWQDSHWDLSHRIKTRCEAVLAMMDKLEEVEER